MPRQVYGPIHCAYSLLCVADSLETLPARVASTEHVRVPEPMHCYHGRVRHRDDLHADCEDAQK